MNREELLAHAANARTLAGRHKLLADINRGGMQRQYMESYNSWLKAAEDLEAKAKRLSAGRPKVASGSGWAA